MPITNSAILEKGMSSFEIYLRSLPVEVCRVFKDDNGKISPAEMFSTGRILTTPDSDKINEMFIDTVSAHNNHILEAIRNNDFTFARGKKVLVLFSGGPAAGGNNVLVGLYKALGSDNELYGVKAGPGGLLKGDTFKITEENIRSITNMGGFDFLGSDRTKIEELEQFVRVKKVCIDQKIDAIVVVGGDDSNTNAAFLAEKLFTDVHENGKGVQVIGVPKTIDGDLQIGTLLPISFGYDTAVKIYSEMVGNIAQDTPSSRKYYHFVKIMGRSASHVALGVSLKVRPPITLISEEIAEKNFSLDDIIMGICKTIAQRAAHDIRYGVILIPEGLIEFIPEMKSLIAELNIILDTNRTELTAMNEGDKKAAITEKLTPPSLKTLDSLPDEFKNMLLLDRDEHGNLPVSQIKTEELLIKLCAEKIKHLQKDPEHFNLCAELGEEGCEKFLKFKFSPLSHFLGYEGRCGAPSRFDMAYTLNLGLVAGSLILNEKTGYMASVKDLDRGGTPLAIPLTGLLNIETRGAKEKIVIKKALVETSSPAFQYLKEARKSWASGDYFYSAGPRQYSGPLDVTHIMPLPVKLNQKYTTAIYNLGIETKLHE